MSSSSNPGVHAIPSRHVDVVDVRLPDPLAFPAISTRWNIHKQVPRLRGRAANRWHHHVRRRKNVVEGCRREKTVERDRKGHFGLDGPRGGGELAPETRQTGGRARPWRTRAPTEVRPPLG